MDDLDRIKTQLLQQCYCIISADWKSLIKQISLLYFEAYHGQNEGDSAHSTIKTALDSAGDWYVPSQLVPIFRLAKRKQPYSIHTPKTTDLLDFKSPSKDLPIFSVRSDDQGGAVDWRNMTKIIVKKTESKTNKIFKTSHLKERNKFFNCEKSDIHKLNSSYVVF